ncbi:MAG: hypothetical protein ACKOZU_01800 [Planctomycetaceae bacterium]
MIMHRASPSSPVPFRLAALAVAAALVVPARPARGVIIETFYGTGNTTAPADDPGFANVGYSTSGHGTAIYLGGGWVLTAGHVGGDGIILASGTYLQASGSDTSFALVNTTPGRTAQTDLSMFKLATEPVGLPTLSIASSMTGTGAAVTMIGGGLDRGAFTQWLVDDTTNPPTWTVTGSNGDAAGFQTLGTQAIRWGTNNVEANDLWIDAGYGDVKSFQTFFNYAPGTSEAQAVLHDSGGAVFTKVGGQWLLAGVITAVGGYAGQPNPVFTAVFGDATYMADLSYYRPQIVAFVPEPSSMAIAAGGAAVLACAPFGRRRWPRAGRPS